MTVPTTAQDRAADMSADGTEPGAVRPTQAYRDWSVRVREVSRLPKPELVRRIRAQGVVFGDLERWSKDELISTLCPILPHEQMWEPADA